MPQASPSRQRQRWLIPVVVLAAALSLAAGMAARGVYHRQATPSSTVVAPATVRPSVPPGSATVQLTDDAADHPMQQPVRDLLQHYFDAINSKSYDDWTQVVTSSRLHTTSRSEWSDDYRTTRDGSIVVYRIESAGTGQLVVLLRFVSVQDPSDAPPDFPYRCIRWHVVFPLAVEHGQWRLDAGETGATPQHQSC